jgi:S1-C subfamily serine protease
MVRPMLGVRYVPITKEFATRNNLPVNEGAFVYGGDSGAVVSGGPADKAGIKEGDIITKINNDKITSSRSLSSILMNYKVGDKVTLTYYRDNKEKTAVATLQESK